MTDQEASSLTNTDYWDRTWAQREIPAPLSPAVPGLNGVVPGQWHRFFSELFGRLGVRPGDRVLEAGCGGSVFLPYFAREFAVVAEGIDNSEEGCALSRAIAEKSAIPTPVYCGDVFNPPAALRGRYRLVYSLGLAEHFTPTSAIVVALREFLMDGGFLVTVVPNMHGLVGTVQQWVDPEVYAVHVPLSPGELARAHRDSGLEVIESRHLMTANFSVVNFSAPTSRIRPSVGLRLASWTSKALWLGERWSLPGLRPNPTLSPYVVVVAQRL